MIAAALSIKDRLLELYAKRTALIKHGLTFILAFLSFFVMGKEIGFGNILSNPFICLAAAMICAFLPVNATVIIASLFLLVHLAMISIELAGIALIILIVVYLLYFRFAPKTGVLLLIAPMLFYLKVPYVIPVIAALGFGMVGIVPSICGVLLFGIMNFAANSTTALTSQASTNPLQNISFIFNNVLVNNKLIVIVVTFSLVTLVVYLIKRMSVDNAWSIAIITGCILDAIILLVAYTILSVDFNIVMLILGHVLAVLAGLVLNLFLFAVDYSSTEYVQFEDNDYYYYVKAVPKMSVTSRDVTIKNITNDKVQKGSIHTESVDLEDADSYSDR